MSISGSDSGSDSSLSSVSSLESEVALEYVGQILKSRYLVLDYLDHGTFCRVYLAYDIQCDKFNAIKILNVDSSTEGRYEIDLLKRVSKCHRIIKIYDDFQIGENICIVLELMGCAVIDVINSIDSKDENFTKVVKTVIRDTVTGIFELNRNLLIHTDLKLENIMTSFFSNRIENIIELVKSLNIHQRRIDFYNKLIVNKSYELNRNSLTDYKNTLREQFNCEIRRVVMSSLENMEIDEDKIVIPDNFICKIIDLGNAEQYNPRNDYNKGTIHIRGYRPPENFKSGVYNPKSDIWTLGTLIYEMLFNEKFLESDFTNNNSKYLEYIIERKADFIENIDIECEFVNFKNNQERDLFCQFILNSLVIDPEERWNIQDCINSKLLQA